MSRPLTVNRFRTTAQGLVPAPGTATGKFLRDDGTWAAAGSGSAVFNQGPDTHTATAPAFPGTDYFEFGSTLDTAGARFTGATPWHTAVVSGYTIGVHNGALSVLSSTGASGNLGLILQTVPVASTWKFRAKLLEMTFPGNVDFLVAGMVAYNSGTTNLVAHYLRRSALYQIAQGTAALSTQIVGVGNWASNSIDTFGMHLPVWFEIESDGTNLIFRLSGSGVDGSFSTQGSTAIASFLGSVTDIGLLVGYTTSAGQVYAAFDTWQQVA